MAFETATQKRTKFEHEIKATIQDTKLVKHLFTLTVYIFSAAWPRSFSKPVSISIRRTCVHTKREIWVLIPSCQSWPEAYIRIFLNAQDHNLYCHFCYTSRLLLYWPQVIFAIHNFFRRRFSMHGRYPRLWLYQHSTKFSGIVPKSAARIRYLAVLGCFTFSRSSVFTDVSLNQPTVQNNSLISIMGHETCDLYWNNICTVLKLR